MIEVLRLWSIGVGSVIGGDFFGWESMLKGGLGAGILAFFLNSILYAILSRTVSELSLRVHIGGAYGFVRVGMGQRFGLLVAGLELIKLFWAMCALCFGLIGYLHTLTQFPSEIQYVCYPILCLVFALLAMRGIKFTETVQIVITTTCLCLLCYYWLSVVTEFNFHQNATPDGVWFTNWRSTLHSIPYGAWLFLGFEELPLIFAENDNPVQDVPSLPDPSLRPTSGSSKTSLSQPQTLLSSKKRSDSSVLTKALLVSYVTVCVSGITTLLVASGGPPGIEQLREDSAPLVAGMKEVYGAHSVGAIIFNVLSIAALFAPCYSFATYSSYHIQVGLHIYIYLYD
jgi:amino acid transporter